MKLKLFIIFSLFFYSCDKETDSNPFVSGNENLNDDYSINLDWDDNYSMNKTSVNIKWNQWLPNDSTQFIKYIIKDVTNTENVKTLENISNVSDTSTVLEFPTGTFFRLCVVVKDSSDLALNYESSDSILFFTEALASVTNLYANPDPIENINTLTWNSSTDNDIDNLIIYRAKTDEEDYVPSLGINSSDGLPNDDWAIVYEGDNEDTIFIDDDIFNAYKYFYCINIQIENQNDDVQYIENYRYSLIESDTPEMTDPIEDHDFNLEASTNFNNYIKLTWDVYEDSDFYIYELWRSDDEANYSKIIEITNNTYNYFEDRNNIGSGKSWWYKIKAFNHFGNSIESEAVEGYANP